MRYYLRCIERQDMCLCEMIFIMVGVIGRGETTWGRPPGRPPTDIQHMW